MFSTVFYDQVLDTLLDPKVIGREARWKVKTGLLMVKKETLAHGVG